MVNIGIVGGGLAGLAAAFWCAERGARVVVFEAAERAGGQIWTEIVGGAVVELGAEGFVARSTAVVELARALGIEGELVDQRRSDSLRLDPLGLTRLAPGEAARSLGFQVDPNDLGRGVRAFRRGMGELTDTLARRVAARSELRLSSPVRSVAFDDGPCVVSTPGARERFDALVVATTARDAAALLADVGGDAARALSAANTSSSVTVSLLYARGRVAHPLDATGFVVADPESARGLRACTFTSSKLPERAEDEQVLLRCFFRPTEAELSELDDAAWSARAEQCLADVLGIEGPAARRWVSRWERALPIFDAEHTRRVQELAGLLAPKRIQLAGSAFHGSGIDAAVRSARAAAQALVEEG